MTQENVELVRRSLEAFARGDFETAFAAFDPDVEWRTAADEPDQQTYLGIAGLRTFVASLAEPWENRFAGTMQFAGFVPRGDWVVAPWTARLRGKGSGISIEVGETYALFVRQGRIAAVEEFRTSEQAFDAIEAKVGPS